MGIFDFFKPKKNTIDIYGDTLSLKERVSIYLTMLFMATQMGNRKTHPAELKYMNFIKYAILGLTDKKVDSIYTSEFNFFAVVNDVSSSVKEDVALMFFNLSTIIADEPMLKTMNMLISDMGFTVEELVIKSNEIQNQINNNPYIDKKANN